MILVFRAIRSSALLVDLFLPVELIIILKDASVVKANRLCLDFILSHLSQASVGYCITPKCCFLIIYYVLIYRLKITLERSTPEKKPRVPFPSPLPI